MRAHLFRMQKVLQGKKYRKNKSRMCSEIYQKKIFEKLL